jgi:ankyrin repeat protein
VRKNFFEGVVVLLDNSQSTHDVSSLLRCIDGAGRTALHWSLLRQQPPSLSLFLIHQMHDITFPVKTNGNENDDDQDDQDDGRSASTRTTISSDLAIYAADDEGYTALHLAASAGFVSVVRALLQQGANVNGTDASSSRRFFRETPVPRVVPSTNECSQPLKKRVTSSSSLLHTYVSTHKIDII